MRLKKILIIVVALVMLVGMTPIGVLATADTSESRGFSDMPKDWSTAALQHAVDNGLLQGANGKLNPKGNLTRAEMAAIIARAFNAYQEADISAFKDVGAKQWYAPYIAKANQMLIMQGSNGLMKPTQQITRQEAFVIIARAIKLAPAATMDKSFTDANKIASWAKGEVAALVNAGYVSGSAGKLNPTGYITRAEFAQIMKNIIENYITEAGTYTDNYTGNVIINVPNVTLKGSTINGDLIIGDGVGDGRVTLEDVVVKGRTIIRGGGEHSIVITGNSNIPNIIIARVDGVVRVLAEDGTQIGEVIADGKDDIIVEGKFATVTVVAEGVVLSAKNATIENINVSGANANLVVGAGSTVQKVTLDASQGKIEVLGKVDNIATTTNATETVIEVGEKGTVDKVEAHGQGTEIKGEGKVNSVVANADDIKVDTPNTKVTAGAGTSGVTVGGKEVEAGSTTEGAIPPAPPAPPAPPVDPPVTPTVSAISVTGEGGATTITENGGTLQMTADVQPENASDKSVTWSVTETDDSATDKATINSTGLLTAVKNGAVKVKATSVGTPAVSGTLEITISGQVDAAGVLAEATSAVATAEGSNLQADVDAAQVLVTALPDGAEKTALQGRIDAVQANIDAAAALDAAKTAEALLNADDYVDYSSVTAALALPETTNAEVVTKTTAINNAIAALVEKADLTAYTAVLVAVVEADYTVESWADYQTVVAANVVTVENTQSEVDAATFAIETAQYDLTFAGQADLDAAKTAEELLTSTDYVDYSAVTAALALPETTNAEVVAKTTAINSAISSLVEAVAPVLGEVTLTTDENDNLVLTVNASDNAGLLSLEVDHSLEGTLPEFTVGTVNVEASAETMWTSSTFSDGTWTLNFGPTVSAAIRANDTISFYFVITDVNGNKFGSMDPTTAANTKTFDVPAEAVAPVLGEVTLTTDENDNLVLTVNASDNAGLLSLEVDHSLEGTLPEFTVGTVNVEASAETMWTSSTFSDGTWTLNFGPTVSAAIRANDTISFYFVITDVNGNKFGSMDPTTDANTKTFDVPAEAVAPVLGEVTLTTDENDNLVLTVNASDNAGLLSLEVDHSLEGTLPEFTVGTVNVEASAETMWTSSTFSDGTWTLNFGPTVSAAIRANDTISFYFVITDVNGNKFGSMDPTTAANTKTFDVPAEAVAPALGDVTLTTDAEDNLVLTVNASDNAGLLSLEVDHSLEGTLPEFTVGTEAVTDETTGASSTFADGTWTLNFGPTVSAAIRANDTISFYFVITDVNGNKFGSMDPTTAANTRTFDVPAEAEAPAIPVTGVKFSVTGAYTTLSNGAAFTLNPTVEPANATNKIVTWTSSDEAVATVDANGVVTPKAAGTAIITVTTADGNFTATRTVNVVEPTATINGVGYLTLNAAISAAPDGATIIVQQDTAITSGILGRINVGGKAITIDLNGHKVESNDASTSAFRISATGQVTFTDSSGTNAGQYKNLNTTSNTITNEGTLIIAGGTIGINGQHAIVMGTGSDTTITGGIVDGYIASNGTYSDVDLTISGGTFNAQLYLPAANSLTTISGGTFTPEGSLSAIEIDAGTLNISGGTFTHNIDTATNSTAVANTNGSGDFKGVIVAVKPSTSSATAYGSAVIVNLTGGTFTNTSGDAIVLADQTASGNEGGGGITVTIGSGATVTGAAVKYDTGTNESVLNLPEVLSYNGAVTGQITSSAIGQVNGALNFKGTNDLIIAGNVTGTGNITTFEGTVSGSINGTITAQINANGIDTLSGVITPSDVVVDGPVRIIGIFGQTGIEGDFEGEIITGPVPTYVETMEITSVAGSTVTVGDTLQLAVDVTPEGASSEVAWSVYVNDREKGSIDVNGLFTGVAAGNVTVIVKALDGSLKDDTFIVTVQTLETAAIAAINAGGATLQDYENAGIIGVSAGNLTDVNTSVATAKATKESDLIKEEIQGVVASVVDAADQLLLARVNASQLRITSENGAEDTIGDMLTGYFGLDATGDSLTETISLFWFDNYHYQNKFTFASLGAVVSALSDVETEYAKIIATFQGNAGEKYDTNVLAVESYLSFALRLAKTSAGYDSSTWLAQEIRELADFSAYVVAGEAGATIVGDLVTVVNGIERNGSIDTLAEFFGLVSAALEAASGD